jgi:uncharacterized membrane protein YadS
MHLRTKKGNKSVREPASHQAEQASKTTAAASNRLLRLAIAYYGFIKWCQLE